MQQKKIFFILLLAFSTYFELAYSQKQPVNFTGWYGYEGYHPFVEGKPWGIMVEGYAKRNQVIVEPMQCLVRVSYASIEFLYTHDPLLCRNHV